MQVNEFFNDHWNKLMEETQANGLDLPNEEDIAMKVYDEKSKRIWDVSSISFEEDDNGECIIFINVEPIL